MPTRASSLPSLILPDSAPKTRSRLRNAAPSPAHRPSRAPAPFVKWVGGKSRLVPQLMTMLPPGADRMRHVEPFAGGAAFFFLRAPRRAYLSDVNADLVATYQAVRDRVGDVLGHLEHLASGHSTEAYYSIRERYNRTSKNGESCPERAAMFIYLNKTCFNGLHRVNRRGEFNVPAGRYRNPKIADTQGLLLASQLLARADIRRAGFEELLRQARPGDFIYFDPPYEPVSATANFTSYSESGFGTADQERLAEVFHALDRRGCALMLSNSNVPSIRTLYKNYRVDLVAAPRLINCDARKRGPVLEVVVRNYG